MSNSRIWLHVVGLAMVVAKNKDIIHVQAALVNNEVYMITHLSRHLLLFGELQI